MVAKSSARKSRSTRKKIKNLASKSLKTNEAGSVKGGKNKQFLFEFDMPLTYQLLVTFATQLWIECTLVLSAPGTNVRSRANSENACVARMIQYD